MEFDGAEPGWETEILASIPSGIDPVQVDRCLALTPTERIERMRDILLQLEKARLDGHELPRAG